MQIGFIITLEIHFICLDFCLFLFFVRKVSNWKEIYTFKLFKRFYWPKKGARDKLLEKVSRL